MLRWIKTMLTSLSPNHTDRIEALWKQLDSAVESWWNPAMWVLIAPSFIIGGLCMVTGWDILMRPNLGAMTLIPGNWDALILGLGFILVGFLHMITPPEYGRLHASYSNLILAYIVLSLLYTQTSDGPLRIVSLYTIGYVALVRAFVRRADEDIVQR